MVLFFFPVEARYEVSSYRQGAGDGKLGGEKNGEDSDGGPPAVLRKWQRQRPREEYTFESDEPPKFYEKLNMASSLSRLPEKSNVYGAFLCVCVCMLCTVEVICLGQCLTGH